MTRRLSEIAEIKALNKSVDLKENDILVSQTGKKIVRITSDNISEYKDKKAYLIISASTEDIDSIYKSLTSKEFEKWFAATAKSTVMPLISVIDLKQFEISI